MNDHTSHAPLIRQLGHAGLVPFVLLAATVWLVDAELQPWAAIAMAAYAALIVSYLGGIHWGLAWKLGDAPHDHQRAHLLWGVVPSLLAWVAVLMPPRAGLVLHGVMLVACYLVDRRVYPLQGVAHWLTLRFRLSSVAAFSCFLAAAGS